MYTLEDCECFTAKLFRPQIVQLRELLRQHEKITKWDYVIEYGNSSVVPYYGHKDWLWLDISHYDKFTTLCWRSTEDAITHFTDVLNDD
jgi:hypothetical protein